jgi:hypothetical protein
MENPGPRSALVPAARYDGIKDTSTSLAINREGALAGTASSQGVGLQGRSVHYTFLVIRKTAARPESLHTAPYSLPPHPSLPHDHKASQHHS